ncbi:MAG: thiolase domain-containing protein [Burkholderiaceae bacterium]|nr:thiolase domain-containing protein [Burkholderiaceae bacterium]
MSIKAKACIVGAFEHPLRKAPGKSAAQIHAEVAKGALDDAGLARKDIDGYFFSHDAPGIEALSLVDYLGLSVRHVDATDIGGCSYIAHVSHAAQAIAAGKCNVALITLGARPRLDARSWIENMAETPFEGSYGHAPPGPAIGSYALVAMRHMYEFGTTSEQLAWIKVAASQHAQHNPNALLGKVVTVQDVLNSPIIADPLHMLDCCVISDGGGALIVARPEIARTLKRPVITVLGAGEAIKGQCGGKLDITSSAAVESGSVAFAEAGVKPADIDYVSVYDSFTIAVLIQLEDLGFCRKGEGGKFVADGTLISGVGRLPFNTDGGGLCNNHPDRGGMTKVIEAVRQLRGEAHPAVQVKNCRVALAQGLGGWLGHRHAAATLILERT